MALQTQSENAAAAAAGCIASALAPYVDGNVACRRAMLPLLDERARQMVQDFA
ncbi:hypothetical protein [Novosphingopyxis baekryungensis]|uniref:hypothetical protein n=1 Tax=Novosphingopyxis baekryungensis TaxID=279369 RepID=UPI0003B516FA|nr:hypothetical protein [Novosphingopyxis baekryungensis]